VRKGDFLGVIGPNGAGKTTLLNVFLGLLRPTRETVSLFGGPVSSAGLRRVDYVPQKSLSVDRGFPSTVYETVVMGRASKMGPFHRFSHEDVDRAEEAMRLLGIHDLKNRKMGQLSGGQFQRVIFAKALVGEPELLVLDEPTSGVDTPTRTEIYKTLEELNGQRGITVVLSTHDIGVVKRLAGRAAFLRGSLLYDGPSSGLSGEVLSRMYDYPIEVVQDDRICDYPIPPVNHRE
jgi:zinc transport system ATP-binding protein